MRRSSRNAVSSAGSLEQSSAAMSDQPLSPAKKLAKLMRERPLDKLSKTRDNVKHPVKVTGVKEPKLRNGALHGSANKKLNAVKQSKNQGPSLHPVPQHSMGDNVGMMDTVDKPQTNASRGGKGKARKAIPIVKKLGDENSEQTRSKKRSKHEEGHVASKRPKTGSQVLNGQRSSKSGARISEQSPSTSKSSARERQMKKPRPKPDRDAAKSDSSAVTGGDIAALLRLGEGADADHGPMSDDSDWEAVDAHSSDLATKGFVEVTLPSDVALQKRKKKGFDVEAYMKRQLNRARRELQTLIHKTHLLCLLSRALQLNKLLNSETALACAMSMLPSKYAYPPKRVSLSYVEKFAKWFREKVPLEAPREGGRPSDDVFRTLETRLRTKKAYSSLELVCLFVLILRAIGVDCRLVVSLQPAPLKPAPSASDSAAAKSQKATSNKPHKSAPGKSVQSAPSTAKKPTPKSKQSSGAKKAKQAPTKSSDGGEKVHAPASLSKSKCTASTPARTSSQREAKRRPRSTAPAADSSDDSADEFEPRRPDRRVLSSSSGSEGGRPARAAVDHWAEVYVEEELRWISVDVVGGGVHCVAQIRKRASTPLMYVLGCDNSGHVKDLTARYDPKWHSATRKLRVDADWWEEAVCAWRGPRTRRQQEEDEELQKDLQERPMPQSIAEFKNHPLYALERHLLKFEAIYPPTAVPLGFIGKGQKSTPVYARECVRMLHSRETWIKQARVVREGEKPYKVVKARPKWDRVLQKAITDKPLEVFGRWQTDDYVPPVASGGMVPRNDYGNVELFKPSMLPGGTVHLKVDGLSRVAKKLGIDCAPAMVGWDYHCGGSHPVFEGYVVCKEFEDTLMDAWEADQREAQRRQRERREKRVLDNWRKLVRGLLIKQRLARKYSFEDESSAQKRPATSGQPATASKKARAPAGSHAPKIEPKLEPKLEPKVEPGTKKVSKVDVKSESRPAAKLGAKMKALQTSKTGPKQEPNEAASEDEEAPETKEEAARRVQASMANMALTRLTLSSDSETELDDGAGAGAETAELCPAAAVAASTSARAPARRRQRAAPVARRRPRKASPADRSPSPSPAPAAGAGKGRATRRRSGRLAAVNYSEKAGSDSDSGQEAPLREDDLTSDEEQPFVRAAETAAVSSDDEDFMGF